MTDSKIRFHILLNNYLEIKGSLTVFKYPGELKACVKKNTFFNL